MKKLLLAILSGAGILCLLFWQNGFRRNISSGIAISTGIWIGSVLRGPGVLFGRVVFFMSGSFAAGNQAATVARQQCQDSAWSRYFSCMSARGC